MFGDDDDENDNNDDDDDILVRRKPLRVSYSSSIRIFLHSRGTTAGRISTTTTIIIMDRMITIDVAQVRVTQDFTWYRVIVSFADMIDSRWTSNYSSVCLIDWLFREKVCDHRLFLRPNRNAERRSITLDFGGRWVGDAINMYDTLCFVPHQDYR